MKDFSRYSMILLCSMLLLGCKTRADQAVHRYINFTGGDERWKLTTTIVMTGDYDYGGVVFPFTTWCASPDKYKVVVPFNGKYFTQAFDGQRGWKIDAFKNETKPTLLEGESARSIINEADVELENPLVRYPEKGIEISIIGDTTLSGHTTSILNVIRKNHFAERWYIDDTGALVLKMARSKNSELGGAMLSATYSDYRDAGGLKFPFRIVYRAGDQTVLTVTVHSVTLNTRMLDSVFKP